MPIHHKHKILFIHIPKTGGSSIEGFFGMTETENLCYGNEIGKIGGVMFALQHLTASLLQQLDFMSMLFDIYFKFAFVRNPYERVLSEYFGQDANRARVDFDLGLFKIWFDETHSIIDTDHKLPQYDFVYDKAGRQLVDFIGRFETINDDFAKILSQIDYHDLNASLPYNNKSSNKRYYIELLDDEIKEKIYDQYKVDFKVFNYDK